MLGTPAMASGIEYHERHTVTPDGRVPSRFGNPIDIPEDLLPIPEARPRSITAQHPLAKFVTVWVEGESDIRSYPRKLLNCVAVDLEHGITTELDIEAGLDAFGCYAQRSTVRPWIQMEYDEDAIRAENDRRLKRALEMAALYAGVIDAHQTRIAAEAAKKAAQPAAEPSAEPSAEPTTTTEESQSNGDHP
jgi:hypothetical protein